LLPGSDAFSATSINGWNTYEKFATIPTYTELRILPNDWNTIKILRTNLMRAACEDACDARIECRTIGHQGDNDDDDCILLPDTS